MRAPTFAAPTSGLAAAAAAAAVLLATTAGPTEDEPAEAATARFAPQR